MATKTDPIKEEVRQGVERLRDLASYALTADQVNRNDEREWLRTVLRAVADMRDECTALERRLSDHADSKKILGPSEIAEAAKISRTALYKRRTASGS